jgi:hypothetical protein
MSLSAPLPSSADNTSYPSCSISSDRSEQTFWSSSTINTRHFSEEALIIGGNEGRLVESAAWRDGLPAKLGETADQVLVDCWKRQD